MTKQRAMGEFKALPTKLGRAIFPRKAVLMLKPPQPSKRRSGLRSSREWLRSGSGFSISPESKIL